MIETLISAAALSVASPALSPKAQALVAAVSAAIENARGRQSAAPPPKDDAERIIRLGEMDQAARQVIVAHDFSKIPEAERAKALDEASAMIKAVDREDQAELLKLVPPEGWFLSSKYGKRAAWAAFDIIQHSGVTLQERFLPVIANLVPAGEVPGESYAMMYDRVD